MQTAKFEATLRSQGTNLIIDLSGEIDAAAEQGLDEAFTAAEESNPQAIILNFNRVGYVNSTGIALIVGLLARARKMHTRLVVFGLSDHYNELFTITRLSDFMSIFPDEASALGDSSPVIQA